MLSLMCLLIFISTCYWYLTRNLNYWKKRGVNGPRPLPLFGNSLDFVLNPRSEIELNYYRKYGNIYGYYLGDNPVLVVGEPELVKTMFIKDFNIFPQRRGFYFSHPILKKSLINICGDDWKRVRSITSPTFTSNKMKLVMYPLMENCINDFMAHVDGLIKTKSNVNIKDIYANLSLDVISTSAFGTKLNLQNDLNSPFVKHAKVLLSINPLKILIMRIIPKTVAQIFGKKTVKRIEKSQKFYFDVVRQIIENRKKSGKKNNDFLQLLIEADNEANINEIDSNLSESHHVNEGKEELELNKKVLNIKLNNSNKRLNEDEIISQAVSFLMAGYETTATTLTYTTYELALNTEVQDKLCEEVNESVTSNGNLDYDTLCRLPYLDAVISETLRHYSPTIKTTRIVSKEYKVGDTGITLYPGQQVDIPIHGIHHDEKYYRNPFKFDPDRFMPQNRHCLVPYTYLPFGGGPRSCIGMRFSLLETKLALAQMVRRYKFFRCNETDIPLSSDPKALLNVPKRAIVGIKMRNEEVNLK